VTDSDDFRARVQARMVQAGYSQQDAERVVRAEMSQRSAGDVPAPMHEKHLPITHFDVMLGKFREAMQEYEESWRRGSKNAGDARAEDERAAVVKYLREMAAQSVPLVRHNLNVIADDIQKGEHL
jgi:hypothetical protein